MHNFLTRGNLVLTSASTVLFTLCATTLLTGKIVFNALNQDGYPEWAFESNSNAIPIDLELNAIKGLVKDRRSGNDMIELGVKLNADFRGAFRWNTKQLFLFVQAEYETAKNRYNQVVLWDAILTSKVIQKGFEFVRLEM